MQKVLKFLTSSLNGNLKPWPHVHDSGRSPLFICNFFHAHLQLALCALAHLMTQLLFYLRRVSFHAKFIASIKRTIIFFAVCLYERDCLKGRLNQSCLSSVVFRYARPLFNFNMGLLFGVQSTAYSTSACLKTLINKKKKITVFLFHFLFQWFCSFKFLVSSG